MSEKAAEDTGREEGTGGSVSDELESGSPTSGEVPAVSGDSAAEPDTSVSDVADPAARTVVEKRTVAPSPASEVPAADSSATEERGGPRSKQMQVLTGALVAMVALLLAAVGVAGYLFVQNRDKANLLAAEAEVRRVACEYAPLLSSYDATKGLDNYFAAVLERSTGDWKKQFETTTGELRQALEAGKVVSVAGRTQCGVKSADETTAEVVVTVEQNFSSLGTQGRPMAGQLSFVMRLEKADGRWLINHMNLPLAPA